MIDIKRTLIASLIFIYMGMGNIYPSDSALITPFLSGNRVLSVALYDSVLWLGTEGGGLLCREMKDSTFTQYTRKDGLGGNTVYMLIFDGQGKLWVATDGGICSISETTIAAYPETATFGPVKEFGSIGTRIAAATRSGVSVYDGNRFMLQNGTEMLRDIVYDSDTLIWALGEQGVYSGVSGDMQLHSAPLHLNPDSMYDIAADRQGSIWIALGDSIARYDSSGLLIFSQTHGDFIYTASQIFCNRFGRMVASGRQGLSQFVNGQWEAVTSLYEDADFAFYDTNTTKFFFASGGPLQSYDGAGTSLSYPSEIERNDIRLCAVDTDNHLWIVPFANDWGIHRYDGEQWSHISAYSTGLLHNYATAFAQDSAGGYWFGGNFGLSYLRENLWTVFRNRSGLPLERILDCQVASDNTLWAACYGGIMRFSGSDWTVFDTSDGLPHTTVNAVVTTSDGMVGAGTSRGFAMLGGDGFIADLHENGPENRRITDLAVSADGYIIVATREGAFHRNNMGAWSQLLADSVSCSCTEVDTGGRIWIGTTSGGLHVFDNIDELPCHISGEDGLPAEAVQSLAGSKEGRMWVATSDGLALVDLPFASSVKSTQKMKNVISVKKPVTGVEGLYDSRGRKVRNNMRIKKRKINMPAGVLYWIDESGSGKKVIVSKLK